MKGSTDFYKVSIKCLADGNFILHKWGTNFDELRDFINTSIWWGTSEKYCKALGINWDTKTDFFVIKFGSLAEDTFYETVTKRNILKSSASLFAPLGLSPPFISKIMQW